MKRIILLSCIILMLYIKVNGQETQQLSIVGGTPVNNVLKPEMQYVFPDFVDGIITFRNNATIKGKFNYNFLVDEIQFLNEKGEKLALINTGDISIVSIDKKQFIYVSKGYYEILENGNFNLLLKRKCKILYYGKKGAYGQILHASSVDQYGSISINGLVTQIDNIKEAIAVIDYSFALFEGHKLIQADNIKGFFKAFAKHKTKIMQYTNQYPVDFKKKDDLIRLTKFCNALL